MASTHPVDVSIIKRDRCKSDYESSFILERESFTRFSTEAFFARVRRAFSLDPPERIAVDFVFLVLLTGNDYLPLLHQYVLHYHAAVKNLLCCVMSLLFPLHITTTTNQQPTTLHPEPAWIISGGPIDP